MTWETCTLVVHHCNEHQTAPTTSLVFSVTFIWNCNMLLLYCIIVSFIVFWLHYCTFCVLHYATCIGLGYWAIFSNPAIQLQVCHNKVELSWVTAQHIRLKTWTKRNISASVKLFKLWHCGSTVWYTQLAVWVLVVTYFHTQSYVGHCFFEQIKFRECPSNCPRALCTNPKPSITKTDRVTESIFCFPAASNLSNTCWNKWVN